jgi:hypothetical protein
MAAQRIPTSQRENEKKAMKQRMLKAEVHECCDTFEDQQVKK